MSNTENFLNAVRFYTETDAYSLDSDNRPLEDLSSNDTALAEGVDATNGSILMDGFSLGKILGNLFSPNGTYIGQSLNTSGLTVSLNDGVFLQQLPLNSQSSNYFIKRGVLVNTFSQTLTAPTTSGNAIDYLVEVSFQDATSTTTNPSFYPSNNLQANSPNTGLIDLQVKAGNVAASGSQTTPSSDTGYQSLCVITINYGDTSIPSSQIAYQGNWIFPQHFANNNLTATRDPGSSDDETQGYSVSSLWVNTSSTPETAFFCLSSTSGQASWSRINFNANSVGSMAYENSNNVNITGGSIDSVSVTGLPAPTNHQDASTKEYVDSAINGLSWHDQVLAQQNAPPTSPANGDRYLIGTNPTGAWANNANGFAIWDSSTSSWNITAAVAKDTTSIAATSEYVTFNGTNWVSFGSAISHSNLQNLGADDHLQYVHISNPRTISAVHTFNPTTAEPFINLGTNAQGQKVIGLNADQLDSHSIADFLLKADNLSGLANLATSRTNLGLGTASTYDAGQGIGQVPTNQSLGSAAYVDWEAVTGLFVYEPTGAYTTTLQDQGKAIATQYAVTLGLAANMRDGYYIRVKNVSTTSISVSVSTGDTIEGGTSITVSPSQTALIARRTSTSWLTL